jgi:nucleotide-binding universal stress UspA family protein
MMKRILCPVDRSPSSLQAFDHAIALARWRGARLHLMEVIEAPNPYGVPTETRTDLKRDLERVLVARRVSDVKVTISLRQGNVVQEILAQAKASRSNLIVIGSHGRGGIQRLVLGSIAEKVLRLSTCPVLTVRRGVNQRRRGRARPPFETILCPTDFSAAANHAVTYARRLAKEANARLILMTAVEWPLSDGVTSGPVADLRKSIEADARRELSRLVPQRGSDGGRAETVVVSGKASAAIVELARRRSADLIVMGVSGRSALDVTLLGSTTHHVIREGSWPVLTVPAVKR